MLVEQRKNNLRAHPVQNALITVLKIAGIIKKAEDQMVRLNEEFQKVSLKRYYLYIIQLTSLYTK